MPVQASKNVYPYVAFVKKDSLREILLQTGKQHQRNRQTEHRAQQLLSRIPRLDAPQYLRGKQHLRCADQCGQDGAQNNDGRYTGESGIPRLTDHPQDIAHQPVPGFLPFHHHCLLPYHHITKIPPERFRG